MKLPPHIQSMGQHFETQLAQTAREIYPTSQRLHEACRYALDGQGKRIRPLLVYLSHQAAGGNWQNADPIAIAVEMVHTYSLVHDDLPCMDNDDWRRGRETTHKVYDEATALLVGDSLLTDALNLIAHKLRPEIAVPVLKELSFAAGGRGMVLGQDLDLFWTDRAGYCKSDLDQIHQLKTGQLIAASCAMGAMSAKGNDSVIEALRKFGSLLGLAFQITDDLLDELPGTGKSQGKDRDQNKLTYLQLMTAEEAAGITRSLTEQAFAEIKPLGRPADDLRQLAESLLQRHH
ncbi:MAG: polyprenyl synthetase family protein [Oligoflexus sp.]